MTPEIQERWEEWIASRPPLIQELARKFPPGTEWVLFSDSLDYYIPYSYCENGTVTMTRISGGLFAPIGTALYNVFGMKPETLFPRHVQ